MAVYIAGERGIVMSRNASTPDHPRSKSKREAKKALVLGTAKKGRTQKLIIIAFALVIAGGVALFLNLSDTPSDAVGTTAGVQPEARTVSYPVSLFADGKARHFEYKGKDALIRYFIIKSSDGVIRAAFDACDVCWRSNKGYFQAGDYMVCRNCGRRFKSVLVNEVKGGCNPAPLNRSVEGDKLVIKVEDIMSGKQFFDFSSEA
jgi:uncharacterized membrane protein